MRISDWSSDVCSSDLSTRQFQITPEGCAYYERATRILADLEEAERAVGIGEKPVGRVRINTSSSYFNHVLAPLLPGFLELYPDITLAIVTTDAVVHLQIGKASCRD